MRIKSEVKSLDGGRNFADRLVAGARRTARSPLMIVIWVWHVVLFSPPLQGFEGVIYLSCSLPVIIPIFLFMLFKASDWLHRQVIAFFAWIPWPLLIIATLITGDYWIAAAFRSDILDATAMLLLLAFIAGMVEVLVPLGHRALRDHR